jgi:hypothetical protein
MPASIQREANDLYVLRISGTLTKPDLGGVQSTATGEIEKGAKPRMLVLLEDFEGFERGETWGELEFLSTHTNDIEKIAIVGPPRWEAHALAFAGAGSRSAPVRYFPTAKSAEALTWLA